MCLLIGVCTVKLRCYKPPFSEWLTYDFNVQQIREIQIEDFLGQPAILNLNLNSGRFYSGKTILINGAVDSIGSGIVHLLIGFGPGKLLLLDQAKFPLINLALECHENLHFREVVHYLSSVTNAVKLKTIFERERAQVIFHAAACKHVPIIENHPEEAIRVNV